MAWTYEDLREDLGLGLQNHKPYAKKKHSITKGEIDPRSMGGLAVISDGKYDADGALETLNLGYWVVYPDGRYEKQHLIELETEKVRHGRQDIKTISVLGREVNIHNTSHAENVKEAVRRIHVELRNTDGKVPHIAKIFKDCMLEDILGESLPLPGFDLDQRVYLPATHNFDIHSKAKDRPQIHLPAEAFLPLAGMRKNTLDTDHSYIGRDFLKARGVIPEIGKRFEMMSQTDKVGKKRKSRKLELRQHQTDQIASNDNARLLAAAKWKIKKAKPNNLLLHKMVTLSRLELSGNNMLRSGFQEAMAALGVINKTHTDMLHSRDYPRTLDHLATYGLLDTASSSSKPPPAKGRFVLTSIGGNNVREVYPGIGADIGGNCKVAETQWKDARSGETRKLGVILDMGSYLIKESSEWDMGHPDVVEKLKHCKDIFISHHHIDHKDALSPYIKRNLLEKSHTVHCTPEVYEMINDMLVKAGVPANDPRRPQFNFLQGTGVIDLKDDKGTVRMSVAYGADAVPHSARCTPVIAYGRNGDEILGSYMYMGDMRYDENWFETHNSAFWDPVALMQEHNPSLNAGQCQPTYTELDGTSATREGRSTTEKEAEQNLTHMINKWFHDKHVGVAIIGTNDGRRESLLRVGNYTGRKMTAFGAAVEFLFRTANKWGVNPYLLKRPRVAESYLKQANDMDLQPHQFKKSPSTHYTGLDDYLSKHAKENKLKAAEFRGRGSNKVKSWFKHDDPGSIMAILSGSQGNPIEFESMTYKLSEARSFWDADPKNSDTATPANLKDWVIIFSQSAIPGNEKHQKTLIKKLATRGATVVETMDDSVRIHNPGDLKDRIICDLINEKIIKPNQEEALFEADGSLYIKGIAAHASGHPKKGDLKLWTQKLTAKMFGVMHFSNPLAARGGYEVIEDAGKKAIDVNSENNLEIEISTEEIQVIGRRLSSIVTTKEEAEPGKQYNKRTKVKRFINPDDKSPYHDLGLRGSTGGPVEIHFGVEEVETIKKLNEIYAKAEATLNHSPKTHAKPRRPYKGIKALPAPEWDPNHPSLVA